MLLGPPASGKGTQASLLGAAFGIPYTSTGAMLRQERVKGSEIGAQADAFTSRGLLFPDELALRVVSQWLQGRTRFILDGFPRTLGQATSFEKALADRGLPLDVAYLLELPEDEIRARMLGRLTCQDCGAVFNEAFHGVTLSTPCPQCGGVLARRNDDTEEALNHRLKQYHSQTGPVVEYYEKAGILKTINVTLTRDEVFQSLYQDMKEAA